MNLRDGYALSLSAPQYTVSNVEPLYLSAGHRCDAAAAATVQTADCRAESCPGATVGGQSTKCASFIGACVTRQGLSNLNGFSFIPSIGR